MSTLLSINNYHYYRGGAETVFLEHNRLFADMDWQVVPFAMEHPANLPSPWSRYFVQEIEFGGDYSWWGKLRRVPKVIYSLEARRNLRRLLSTVTPDVCHAHNIYHHLSPSVLGLLHGRGIPTVVTLHDLKIACPAYRMLSADGICERCRGGRIYNVARHRCIKGSLALSGIALLEAAVHRALGTYQRHVNRFVVPSRFYMAKFVEWGFDARRFRYVPNFVHASRFVPRFEPGRAFVFAGRLSAEKGVATLIRAAAAARVPLVIAGGGPEAGALRVLADSLGAEVQFTGHLSGEALHQVIRDARAVVVPSEWYENAPLSVLEAYALGKPVIGAAVGGIPELIEQGVTGSVFPMADAPALSEQLRRYIDTPAERIAAMGARAREWVEREYSLQRYRDRILDVYREIGVNFTGDGL